MFWLVSVLIEWFWLVNTWIKRLMIGDTQEGAAGRFLQQTRTTADCSEIKETATEWRVLKRDWLMRNFRLFTWESQAKRRYRLTDWALDTWRWRSPCIPPIWGCWSDWTENTTLMGDNMGSILSVIVNTQPLLLRSLTLDTEMYVWMRWDIGC